MKKKEKLKKKEKNEAKNEIKIIWQIQLEEIEFI